MWSLVSARCVGASPGTAKRASTLACFAREMVVITAECHKETIKRHLLPVRAA